MSDKYLLGNGVITLGTTAIALTRGGGSFSIDRTYKEVMADGDFGPVKGRIRKDRSVAKLNVKMLEFIVANMVDTYPGLSATVSGGQTTIAATTASTIPDADFTTVKWTGALNDGTPVVIELTNAVNLEGINWSLVDKDEVIQDVTWTAAYSDSARTTEPWSIKVGTAV
jgi:hypothetical protein